MPLDGAEQRMAEASASPAVAWRPLTPVASERETERRSCPPAVRPQNDGLNRIEQNRISVTLLQYNNKLQGLCFSAGWKKKMFMFYHNDISRQPQTTVLIHFQNL